MLKMTRNGVIRVKFKPHTYQETAIQFALNNPASGLLLDMGLRQNSNFPDCY